MDFVGTSRGPVAAQIHVPGLIEEVQLQALNCQHVVLLVELDMRADPMGVQKDHIFGEVVVMVDDVLEVDIAFFALVILNGVFCIRVVDQIDCVLPSATVTD